VPPGAYDVLIGQIVAAGLHPEFRMMKADHLARMGPADFGRIRQFLEEHGLRTFTHGPLIGII